MNTVDVKVKRGRIDSEPSELLVLTHSEGESTLGKHLAVIDRALGGWLRDVLKSGEFQGKLNQTVMLHTHGRIPAKRVLLVGLGKKKDMRVDYVRQAMATATKQARQAKVRSFATPVHGQDLVD